ncbi:hypothetical protein [Paenibacillus lentus]|uniref:Uncharacterized protein n=1 Tax=Paenibacillus lentus TaxID=1338368 RepID=A0A3S8RPM7_9BACL|nr:hypothetical protein [Paenibacillus lentus]AZK44985.1 hypothetical protein EIM92_01245 [Paenibacillus lentus]
MTFVTMDTADEGQVIVDGKDIAEYSSKELTGIAVMTSEPFEVQVAGVTENYAMHFIYMTPSYYEGILDKEPEYNTQLQ